MSCGTAVVVLFLLIICSQLCSSRSPVLCADGGTSSSHADSHMLHLPHYFPRLSCPFSFFALQWSSPSHPFLLFISLFWDFFPSFCASPLAVPYSPVAPCVCDFLPSAGHPVGLANMCFCSCCLNPEGAFWV